MQPISNICQSPVGGIKKHVRSYVILRPNPFTFEYPPKRFSNVQLRRVRWQVEKEESSSFPYRSEFFYFLVSVNRGIIKDDESTHFQIERHPVKETDDLVRRHLLEGCEAFISVITVYHPKDIETCDSLRRYVDILPSQLPAVRDVSFCTCVTLISIIEPYASLGRLTFKFLQLLDLVFIELRRGYSPWAFSYSLISCANADKKRLNVESLASLPEAFSHAALALLTLCLSCSIARRTSSSSVLSIIGFLPRPGRVFRPSMPSDLKRFTQEFTLTWLISVCLPADSADRPSAFNKTARQRIRKQCFSPRRNPFSSARRSASVNSNTFGFPMNNITGKIKKHFI